MTANPTALTRACIFCDIVSRRTAASIVFEDESVIVFMSLHPVTPGHLLVVPRAHTSGLEDIDSTMAGQLWSVGHDMARALRRSTLRCDGINLFVCDGEVAFQTVFHFHLHVIPRYEGDSWNVSPEDGPARDRSLLDLDAHAIRVALGGHGD